MSGGAKGSAGKIAITAFDDLFPDVEQSTFGQILDLPLTDLYPFKDHPFKVLDDEKMEETTESIRQYGVLVPAIARPRPAGGYELVAGHRRKRGSELAEKPTMPVIVRDLDDDEATIIMVDSNIQRENLLPSEKAFAYKMKLDALKHQGSRTDLTSARAVPRLTAREQIAQDAGEKSGMAVTRFVALTKLLPELLELVDTGKFAVSTAADFIADLPHEAQGWLLTVMRKYGCVPSTTQLGRMKKYQQDGELTAGVIDAILSEERPAPPVQVTIKQERLTQYFPKEYSQEQVEQVIFSLLEQWHSQNKTE